MVAEYLGGIVFKRPFFYVENFSERNFFPGDIYSYIYIDNGKECLSEL